MDNSTQKRLACIVTDADGTLLSKTQHIHPKDIATIKALKEKGIIFTVATGRHSCMCKKIVEVIGDDVPIICDNGSSIVDFRTGEVLSQILLDKELVMRFWNWCKKHNKLYYISTANETYAPAHYRDKDYPDELIRTIMQGNPSIEFIPQEPDFTPEHLPVIKVMAANVKPHERKALLEEMGGEDLVEITGSAHDFIDITPVNCNKASALKVLSEKLNFVLEETMALGDQENDVEMLKAVAYPVATANALDILKKQAIYITYDCENAPITQAVSHLFPELSIHLRS